MARYRTAAICRNNNGRYRYRSSVKSGAIVPDEYAATIAQFSSTVNAAAVAQRT
jgi:hypothetical protein